MVSRAQTNIPRRGDKVWLGKRFTNGLQPNGRVIQVFYDSHSALVQFMDAEEGGHRREDIPWEEFEGNFRPEFGGYWHIEWED